MTLETTTIIVVIVGLQANLVAIIVVARGLLVLTGVITAEDRSAAEGSGR